MIGRQRSPEQTMNKNGISPEQTMNKNGIQSNGLGYASIEVRPRVWYLNSTAKLFFVGPFDFISLLTSYVKTVIRCQFQWQDKLRIVSGLLIQSKRDNNLVIFFQEKI